MVLHPLLLTHDRIEGFGVEVAIVDLMAARTQSRDDLLMQRRPEARDDWIRVQNKNAQRRPPSVCAARERLVLSWHCGRARGHSGIREQPSPQPGRPILVQHGERTVADVARFIGRTLRAPLVRPMSISRTKRGGEELLHG